LGKTEGRSTEMTQAELRCLESQLSHYNNISARRDGACEIEGDTTSHEGSCMPEISSVNAEIKLKPNTFNAAVPLPEFLTQFNNRPDKCLARCGEGDRVSVELKREGASGS